MTMTMTGSAFDPTTSSLVGLDNATLQAWRTAAQTALNQLMIGAKVASASYSQADGSQSVTYTQTDVAKLQQWIALLNAQLGVARRRPVRFLYQ